MSLPYQNATSGERALGDIQMLPAIEGPKA